jgi:putative addiction module component (TIGR02574 family)
MPRPHQSLPDELLKLSPAERIQLAEDLWDSVAAHPEGLPPMSEAERREIDRRLAEHEAAPESAIPWEEVRKRLWSEVK